MTVRAELDASFLEVVRAGHSTPDQQVREYLLHGVGRRLGVLRECLAAVFATFEPARTAPLSQVELYEVQINLHAFVINLSGLFDNLAWAFVLRHSLVEKVGGRKRVGMFLASTQKVLPAVLREYVTSPTMVTWHGEYLKAYRDSLAHRIPLYIPPATFTPQDQQRYVELDEQERTCILAHEWEQVEQVRNEKLGLGKACPLFVILIGENSESRPNYLHPQMLCDAKTVLEFCPLFLKHWHAVA
jgi:hypothetical protein